MPKNTIHTEHYFSPKPKSKPQYGLLRTHLRGRTFEFLTASGVFSKKRIDLGTRLLIKSMQLPDKGYVLDMGCGYGPVGIVAAALNPHLQVVLVDVNFRAVLLAKQNLQRNCVTNAEVRRGRLYIPVETMTFDCILSNPPVSAGMATVRAIIIEAPEHMNVQASFQMVTKSKIASKRLRTFFEEAFGNCEVTARESGYRILKSQKT